MTGNPTMTGTPYTIRGSTTNTALRADRRGAALVLALLLLVVLDCIVIGALHLSLQEHRIGVNRAMLLRLRLDAESGARLALAYWSARFDSLHVGSQYRVAIPEAGGGRADVNIERLGDRLFLIQSIAAEPQPRAGRSSARLLVMPPALPDGIDPAAAPLSAASEVHVLATGMLDADVSAKCGAPAGAAYAALITGPTPLQADDGAQIDGMIGLFRRPNLIVEYDRIAEIAAGTPFITIVPGDTTLRAGDASGTAGLASGSDHTEPVSQVLLVGGTLNIAGGTAFRGLIIARGSVTIEAGASVHGAVHAAGTATIAGAVRLDTCAVSGAVQESGMDRPRPAGSRAWLPF
jgi:hypothetical protein